jgi:hypothetical protein
MSHRETVAARERKRGIVGASSSSSIAALFSSQLLKLGCDQDNNIIKREEVPSPPSPSLFFFSLLSKKVNVGSYINR